jgi:hypothetical protein
MPLGVFAPWRRLFLLAAIGATAARCLVADPPPPAEPRDESRQYAVETLLAPLHLPCCIAVRPGAAPSGPFELYIAEWGTGRVVRWLSDRSQEPKPVVTDFPRTPGPFELPQYAGPLGLDFLSPNRLVVGTGDEKSGELRVYNLPPDGAPQKFDQADQTVGPVGPSSRSSGGEGYFFSLAHSETAFFAVSVGGDERGWVLKATLDANRLAGFEPFIATKAASGVPHPSALTINPTPNRRYLVVAQRGDYKTPTDSRVTMYSPASGEVALNLAVSLRDVVALGYSPTGDLYAADRAGDGGVYRLEAVQVDGRESCRAVKIASVSGPRALAFTPDGVLYVVADGAKNPEPNDDDEAPDAAAGSLVRIKPQDGVPAL